MKKRIILLPQVYPPELHPTAVMFRELALYLSETGWDVSVSVGWPHHPQGAVYSGWKKKLFQRSRENGIDVLRSWHFTTESRRLASRAGVMFTQSCAASLGAVLSARPDVVLVCGPPLLGPDLGALAARVRGAKFVNVIYDIYPDVAIETGKLRSPALQQLARLAEHLQYRMSDRTIVLSEGFKRALIAKGVPLNSIDVVPVWIDENEVTPLPRLNPWREEHGIPPEKFVVLYAGTIGLVSGAEVILGAAELLRERTDILFLFVGTGELHERIEKDVTDVGLENVRFLPFQPRERLAEVQATADVGLVTLAKGRGRTSVPSKILGYMAAARPILASVDEDSDTACEIRDANCGFVVPPGDSAKLAECVIRMRSEPENSAVLGRAGRDWLVRHHAKSRVLARFAQVLNHVWQTASAK